MLKCLDEFREKLDDTMHKCMDKRIVLYGYGYSGKFVAWYAEYYHSIQVDYIITQDMSSAIPYEFPLYRDTLFDFGYKDVKEAIVWLCLPETEEIKERLVSNGYIKNETYYNWGEIVYGEDYKDCADVVGDVQFLKWLENRYGCDFVTRILRDDFQTAIEGMCSCVSTTPKEIFPILDKCHCKPGTEDAIFDFGCGKGSAMVTFMDYGFQKVGGVEYEPSIFNIMKSNFEKLGMDTSSGKLQLINGDASKVKEELDEYNWFYFFDPFRGDVFFRTIENICESVKRKPRKAYIISILPRYHEFITDTGMFVLTNQFDIMSRQRVVDVFVTKKVVK